MGGPTGSAVRLALWMSALSLSSSALAADFVDELSAGKELKRAGNCGAAVARFERALKLATEPVHRAQIALPAAHCAAELKREADFKRFADEAERGGKLVAAERKRLETILHRKIKPKPDKPTGKADPPKGARPVSLPPEERGLTPAVVSPPALAPVAASAPNQQAALTGGPMVSLPTGTFMMGSADGDSDEKEVHAVTVSAFAIDKTEVTVAAYEACVAAKKCTPPGTGAYCNWGRADRKQHPVNCVQWAQAVTYCAAVGRGLPTEAEWEYAARGEASRQYPWAAKQELGAQVCWRTGEGTCAVDDRRFAAGATPEGLLHMAGNVWEWTADWYAASYPAGAVADPLGPKSGNARAVRGGSWDYIEASDLRGANRNRNDPSERNDAVGFRCARGAKTR